MKIVRADDHERVYVIKGIFRKKIYLAIEPNRLVELKEKKNEYIPRP